MPATLASHFQDRQVGDYLSALSSGEPTPGGGSAAGLAGAMGCSLGAMVCNLTLKREPAKTLEDLRETFFELQSALLRQAEADENAFTAYRNAIARPKSTESEKAARRSALEEALIGAAEVPLAMVTIGLEALATLHEASIVTTAHALGDLATGGFLLQAMILGSLENIEANARLMKNEDNRERFERAAASARTDLDTALSALILAISTRNR